MKLPAKSVPAFANDVKYVSNKPMLEIFADAVKKLFAEANPAVNCAVPDATTDVVTPARELVVALVLLWKTSPDKVVASDAGAPPVPSAI